MQGDCWGYCCVGVEASCMIFTCNLDKVLLHFTRLYSLDGSDNPWQICCDFAQLRICNTSSPQLDS